MRADFFVATVPDRDDEDERFVILRPDEIPAGFFFAASVAEWRKTLTPLTEDGFRLELAGMGLSSDEVDYQLRRARKARTYDVTWERTTEIGFRNVHRQEVTRKTELPGSAAFQRIFTMRCGDCGYQYGSDGCDVHSRRCPRCQNESPGLPTTDLVE